MAATWLSQTDVKTLVVERQPFRTQAGHADGLESRTVEILDSFGKGDAVWSESNPTIEVCLWVSVSQVSTGFQECTLGQARIEEHLLNFMRDHGDVKVKWGTVPTSIQIDESGAQSRNDNPVEVKLKQWRSECNGPEAEMESVFRTKLGIAFVPPIQYKTEYFSPATQSTHIRQRPGKA
ncbi:hypothetical protein N8T08_002559 [Aspergillus melleus]|uniref:Uncharacterized protein n=1 Tax=Aspergillus melleus TaxID=138277 RepID=A0ACC3B8R8_9EURO|nr:hypothetical protein N8T08_002559 [Aspergillus melleus]